MSISLIYVFILQNFSYIVLYLLVCEIDPLSIELIIRHDLPWSLTAAVPEITPINIRTAEALLCMPA